MLKSTGRASTQIKKVDFLISFHELLYYFNLLSYNNLDFSSSFGVVIGYRKINHSRDHQDIHCFKVISNFRLINLLTLALNFSMHQEIF